MKKFLSSHGLKMAIVGVAIAATGAAVAGERGPQRFHHERGGHHACAPHGGPGFHHGGVPGAYHHGGKGGHGYHHGVERKAGLIVPGYGAVSRDFVDGMGLNPEQLKLVEEARTAGEALREDRRERMKAERAARTERFAAGTVDPEQALKQADERRAQAQAERRKVEEKWIAVWKSLDSAQQARVAEHLKQRAERAQQRAQKLQELRQMREAGKAKPQGGAMTS